MTSNIENKTNIKGWYMLMLSFVAVVVVYIPYFGYTTQSIAIMEDLSLSYTELGFLASVCSLSYGIVLLFTGPITYRWGARNVAIIGLAVCIISQILFFFAESYSILIVCRILAGAGVGLSANALLSMPLRWLEHDKRLGLVSSIIVASEGIGSIFTLYAFALLLVWFGWKTGMLLGAVILGVVLIACIIFLKDPPGFNEFKNKGAQDDSFKFSGIVKIITNRNVIGIALYTIALFGLFTTVSYWLPTILIEIAGWTVARSGIVSALFASMGIFAFIFGMISDRLGVRRPLAIVAAVGTSITFGVLTFAFASGLYLLLSVMLVLTGYLVYSGLSIMVTMMTEAIGGMATSIGVGFYLAAGSIFGGFIYPLFMGYIKDATGSYTVGFIAVTISVAVFAIAGVLISKDKSASAN